MRAQAKRPAIVLPLLLIAGGAVLLLHNFLLIDLDLAALWPALLVLAGLQVLVRGDIAPSWQAHTFGITRGSVQSASVEIESGEVDVQVRALRKPGRLIAGQYTARSRPNLAVRNNHATLQMRRGQTWWLSMADWDVGLAGDLPWSVLASSYLGNLEVDLRGLLVEEAHVASGMGAVTLVCPDRPCGPIYARSTFGDLRIALPENVYASITIKASPFARVRLDPARYDAIDSHRYTTRLPDDAAADAVKIDLTVSTTFGAITIS